jgi:DNA (cytosine-5)-methyltransferase 1
MKAVDLFAGWGGFTLGAERAGARVVWAANHWPLAVRAHAANHPHTEHSCQDLRQADFTRLPDYDLLLASPACQGHSEASQPRRRAYHDAMRATAWAVVDCAEATRPRALVVENVVPFMRWALLPSWLDALHRLGYRTELRVVNAAHHGVPQRRRRLFVLGTRTSGVRALQETTEPAFGPCVDWTAGDWRPLSQMASGARARVEQGRKLWGDRFVAQHVTGNRGWPLHEPIRTITTADQFVVVDGRRYRPLTIRETARAMGFPDGYEWPVGTTRRDTIEGLGNAVCPPVATAIVRALMEAA